MVTTVKVRQPAKAAKPVKQSAKPSIDDRIAKAVSEGIAAQTPKKDSPPLDLKDEPKQSPSSDRRGLGIGEGLVALAVVALLLGGYYLWQHTPASPGASPPTAGYVTKYAGKTSVARDVVTNVDASTLEITSDPCTLSMGTPGLVARVKATNETRCVKKN